MPTDPRPPQASEPPLLVLGAGGHGKVIADILLAQGRPLAGFVDGSPAPPPLGLPHLGDQDGLPELVRQGLRGAVCGVGNPYVRRRLHDLLRDAGLELVTAVHPSATVAPSAHLGPGTVVMPGAVVGPDSHLGEGVVVNTGATVDHDCRLGDFSMVCPGAHLGGNVTLEAFAFVGLGAGIRHGVRIGQGTVVGLGAGVVGSLPAGCLALGLPARAIRDLGDGETGL